MAAARSGHTRNTIAPTTGPRGSESCPRPHENRPESADAQRIAALPEPKLEKLRTGELSIRQVVSTEAHVAKNTGDRHADVAAALEAAIDDPDTDYIPKHPDRDFLEAIRDLLES